jgi:hypothetical protein
VPKTPPKPTPPRPPTSPPRPSSPPRELDPCRAIDRSREESKRVVTALQEMYADLREQGHRHDHALDVLADRLGVDRPTVQRVLQRAERDHGRSWHS